MPSTTTNFGWLRPTIGGDTDIWGDELNTNLTSQDSLLRRFMNCFINSSAPAEAQAGTLWLNNTTNPYELNIYDGIDWILMGYMNTSTNTFDAPSTTNYIGDMKFSAQTSSHGSWLLCNGASVSTTTYSGLFALIGYAFGGSGANFTLPDLRGRVPGAIGTGSGLTPRTMGATAGAETHTLTSAQLPDPLVTTAGTFTAQFALSGTCIQSNTVGAAGSIANTGGGQSHNIMQPTLFVGNYFIFSGV